MKSEYILKGNVHKSWVLILIIMVILSCGASYLGYLFAESNTRTWESQYSGIQQFNNVEEAQNFQTEILKTANEYNAKVNVNISVSSPPVVSYGVTCDKQFPYGDHPSYPNPFRNKIMMCILGFLGGFVLQLWIVSPRS